MVLNTLFCAITDRHRLSLPSAHGRRHIISLWEKSSFRPSRTIPLNNYARSGLPAVLLPSSFFWFVSLLSSCGFFVCVLLGPLESRTEIVYMQMRRERDGKDAESALVLLPPSFLPSEVQAFVHSCHCAAAAATHRIHPYRLILLSPPPSPPPAISLSPGAVVLTLLLLLAD